MQYYVISESGRIEGKVDTNVLYIPGEGIEVAQESHYWDSEFKLRRVMPVVVTGTRVTNIPSTGTVTVTGPLEYAGPVVGDELNITFDLPGTYTVTITPDGVQWLPTTVTLEVP